MNLEPFITNGKEGFLEDVFHCVRETMFCSKGNVTDTTSSYDTGYTV